MVQGANLIFKSVRVLDAVAEAREPCRIADVVHATGLPRGTVHRILEALMAERLVRRDESTLRYRLGARMVQLARRALDDLDLRAAAEPEMTGLVQKFGETALLALWVSPSLVVIDRQDGHHAMRFSSPIGSRLTLGGSALGKAFLSALPAAQRAEALAADDGAAGAPSTATDPSTFLAHLEMLANRGFAVDEQAGGSSANSVAAPILDSRGQPLGAIGIVAPTSALTVPLCMAIGRELVEVASRVSANLGFHPPADAFHTRDPDGADPLVRVAVRTGAYTGTNPVWSSPARRLYWVDVAQPVVHRSDPATGEDTSIALATPAANVVLSRKGLLAGLHSGLSRIDPDTGHADVLLDVLQHGGRQRYNTARCDRQGRLWITTMDITSSRPEGALFRVDPDLTVTRMEGGFLVPIGLAWSPDDDAMYLCDAPRREIYVYAFDAATGTLSDRRVFARVAEGAGRPGGLATDRDGFVWNAQPDGWRVLRYDPGGRVDRIVRLPVPKPIDCCFGGVKLQTLFITTSRLGLSERRLADVPLSGSVLALDVPTGGTELPTFALQRKGRGLLSG